jgi:glycyl-tRNA synthetase beta chain (EC 6.1.1.14)
MKTRDFLLEIGLEEVPARYLDEGARQLADRVTDLFRQNHISFGTVHIFATPRRMAVLVEHVAEKQDDVRLEVRGPSRKVALEPDGRWSKAAIGFTRGQGKTVEDIYFKEVNGTEYAFVEKHIQGVETLEILKQCGDLIASLHFPKNMRWGNQDFKFIRPIHWIVALFGQEIVPFRLLDMETGRITMGHRFYGKTAEIDEPRSYVRVLREQGVIADPDERKAMIVEQLKDLEEKKGWRIPMDEDLLSEVTNLVEYPSLLCGSFDKDFLRLPKEVLITTMKEHQRYFAVENEEGELLPYFVTVLNGKPKRIDGIRRGNEKVLRARFQDAVFFYEEDQRQSIDHSLEKLSKVIYHEKIGTFEEKLGRIGRLTDQLVRWLGFPEEKARDAVRAASICKFDLATQMVYEFPELQGIMGKYYARIHGEKESVAIAMDEHYRPRQADGDLPETDIGAVVAIADKMDTIVSLFAIGMVPSGSQDPFSLRRQALGIVNILLERNWPIDLQRLFQTALSETEPFRTRAEGEILQDLNQFFNLRFKYLLEEKGCGYDTIDAVLGEPVGSIPDMVEKAMLLERKRNEPSFKSEVEALVRVVQIAKNVAGSLDVDPAKFENVQEHRLYDEVVRMEGIIGKADVEETYRLLSGMKDLINDYFDHNMVMADDENIRNNRLALMGRLTRLIVRFAHFQKMILK